MLRVQLVALCDDPGVLWLFLRLLRELATYDEARRPVVVAVWPSVMGTVLDEATAGRDVRAVTGTKSAFLRHEAFSSLILSPELSLVDSNPDSTLEKAKAGWINLEAIRPSVERWLPEVIGIHTAVDDLTKFLRTLPGPEQVDPGLSWITAIINEDYALVSQSWLLPGWLEDVSPFVARADDLTGYRTLLDGCAATGDARFAALQNAEER